MKHRACVNDSVTPAESGHAEMAHDSAETRGPYSDGSHISATRLSARSTAATMALIVGLTGPVAERMPDSLR